MSSTASYDPGSRSPALVIASEGEGAPVRLLLARTFQIGRKVDLPVPKVHEWTDKKTGETRSYTQTYRYESSPEDERAHAREVFALLIQHGVSHLVIEQSKQIHLGEGSSAQGSQIATNIAIGRAAASSIATLCDTLGIRVSYLSAVSWRARVCGKAHAKDHEARDAVRPLLDPAGAQPEDEHQIDAAGLLLGSRLPPPPPKERKRDTDAKPRAKRTPGEPRAKRKASESPWYLKQKAEKQAAKAAAGCVGCPGKHVKTCPAFKPQKASGKPRNRRLWRTPQISGRWTETCY